MSALQELAAQVQQTLDELRPGIQGDGGDIELVSLDGDIVRVRLSGACTHCAFAAQTLGHVRRQLVSRLGRPSLRVLPAPAL